MVSDVAKMKVYLDLAQKIHIKKVNNVSGANLILNSVINKHKLYKNLNIKIKTKKLC